MLPAWRLPPAGAVAVTAVALVSVPTAFAQKPSADPATVLLDRASAYVASYVKTVSSVVAEERYTQLVQRQGSRFVGGGVLTGSTGSMDAPSSQSLTLVSDFLLVLVPGASEWIPFRDVYSVDGRPVRDRDDRLLKLFVEPHSNAIAQAERIRAESSRYNIGNVSRDINVPTFALEYLMPRHRGRSVFRTRGTERVGDVDTAVVEFEERTTPTLIAGREHESVPARGRFWIEPASGIVVRTLLETKPAGMSTRITVTYQREPKLDLWLPVRMDEKHSLGTETIEGQASYSNFRRFQVEATFDIKK